MLSILGWIILLFAYKEFVKKWTGSKKFIAEKVFSHMLITFGPIVALAITLENTNIDLKHANAFARFLGVPLFLVLVAIANQYILKLDEKLNNDEKIDLTIEEKNLTNQILINMYGEVLENLDGIYHSEDILPSSKEELRRALKEYYQYTNDTKLKNSIEFGYNYLPMFVPHQDYTNAKLQATPLLDKISKSFPNKKHKLKSMIDVLIGAKHGKSIKREIELYENDLNTWSHSYPPPIPTSV